MLDFKSFKYVMNSTSITILYLDFTYHSVYMPKYNKLILYCTSNDAWRAIIKLKTLKTAKYNTISKNKTTIQARGTNVQYKNIF